jgi:hypothetical protein
MGAQILEEKQFLIYKESQIYNRNVTNTFTEFMFTVAESLFGI